MIDDAELLCRYAAGRDEAAFTEFVRRNAGLVVASATRRLGGDEHRARDVAQRVFFAAARNARVLAAHRSVTAWLFTATRNAVVNLMRDEERRARREREAVAEGSWQDGGDGAAEEQWAEIRPRLERAMDELGERDREAVLLRYFSGLPLAEVGRRLGLTENAARMRVQRALDKLNAMLARGGAASTSAVGLGAALSGRASVAVPGEVVAGLAKGSIAQAASVAAGGVIFMSATKWAMGIAGACALVTVAGLWSYSRTEWRAAEEARQSVASRVSEQRKAHAELQRRAVESEAEAMALEKRVGQERAALSGKVSEAEAPRWDPVAEGNAFMARNPEVKRALDRYVVAANWFKYGTLFKERGWSDAQIAEFIELTTNGVGMGALLANGNSVTLRHGGPRGAPDFGERMQRLLGSEGLQRWDQLRQELAGKYVAREVASALYFTEAPLSPEQARDLVQIVTATKPPKGVSGVVALKWDEVIEKARAKLAPEQVAAIEVLRAKGEFARLFGRPRDASGTVLSAKGKATP